MCNFIIFILCRRGVRQGYEMGTTILCVTLRRVFYALLALLGPDGSLFSYADDVYMRGVPHLVEVALSEASGLYAMVSMRLGWSPKKTK